MFFDIIHVLWHHSDLNQIVKKRNPVLYMVDLEQMTDLGMLE